MAKRKDMIPSPDKRTQSIIKPGIKPQNDTLSFNFDYNFMKSVNKRYFHNMLKNEADFSEKIYLIMSQTVPNTQKTWNTAIPQGHTHRITGDEKTLALKVVEELHGNQIDFDNLDIWQIAPTNSKGCRVVCSYIQASNTLIPLFIDYHHQLYPSKTRSAKEQSKTNKFCPSEKWG